VTKTLLPEPIVYSGLKERAINKNNEVEDDYIRL
jgi:hypothetical protein